MSWQSRASAGKSRVVLVEHTPVWGLQKYFFVDVPEKNKIAFDEALKGDEKVDLRDYGAVVVQGEGKPSDEVMLKMRDEYNYVSSE